MPFRLQWLKLTFRYDWYQIDSEDNIPIISRYIFTSYRQGRAEEVFIDVGRKSLGIWPTLQSANNQKKSLFV